MYLHEWRVSLYTAVPRSSNDADTRSQSAVILTFVFRVYMHMIRFNMLQYIVHSKYTVSRSRTIISIFSYLFKSLMFAISPGTLRCKWL